MIDRTTVVLVENTYLLRAGIENLLQELPGMLLREVFDGTEKHLCDKIRSLKPELVIINCNLNPELLINLVNNLRKENGLIQIGLASENTAINICSQFTHLIRMNDEKFEILEAIRNASGKQNLKNAADPYQQHLSSRELTILKKVALGLTNQEIADILFLSIHTVMTHRKNITKKLGIKTVSGLTVYALMNKLVDMNEVELTKK